ncbi:TIGR02594 family protein [Candidatus Marithioploca araucensis]|uniref:TIGR02594 family protein n=1 Tax=Candidatus Marithioploca araucensis TaxID=70273 RepID=A0ABT7VUK0_9GAMM|nr:TIGR02594 family protein [Candidatus Marithioploca araucensis]
MNVPGATTSQTAPTTAAKAENNPADKAENVSPDVASQTAPAERDNDDAPWFDIAIQEKGVKEIRGRVDNPRIVEYHQTTTLRATDDETPWCSAFVNWCMQQADIQGTNSASSRSWRNWGKRLREPRKGCIVCFNGHVGFYDSERGRKIMILGGNQSNQVNIIPYSKSRVLTYRWPD